MAVREADSPAPAVEDESTTSAEAASGEAVTELEADDAGQTLVADNPLEEQRADVVDAAEESDADESSERGAELKSAIEAMLFASPEPQSARRLANALGDTDAKEVRRAVDELREQYDTEERGMQILEVAGGYQMGTRGRYADCVMRLSSKKKKPLLTNAALETLAIIAYRQPIIRAEVETIRGVESSGIIRNLLDLEVIEVVGRKEVIGRPPMYGTTPKFLKTFGLRRISDLPTIRGLRERFSLEDAEAEAKAETEENVDTESNAEAEAGAESESNGDAEASVEAEPALDEETEDETEPEAKFDEETADEPEATSESQFEDEEAPAADKSNEPEASNPA